MYIYIYIYIYIKIINSQILYIRWMKYLVNWPIFCKFYMQSALVKPCRMYFTHTFQLTFVGQLMILMAYALTHN